MIAFAGGNAPFFEAKQRRGPDGDGDANGGQANCKQWRCPSRTITTAIPRQIAGHDGSMNRKNHHASYGMYDEIERPHHHERRARSSAACRCRRRARRS